MKRFGTFEEVLDKVFNLFVNGEASYESTREFLKGMKVFTDNDIELLMESLVENKRRLVK